MEDSVKSVRAIEPMLIAHDNDLFARIKQQANILGTLSKIQRADLKICNISDLHYSHSVSFKCRTLF